MKKIATVLTLLALAACSTVEGAGQDLQSAGKAVSHEARKAEAGM